MLFVLTIDLLKEGKKLLICLWHPCNQYSECQVKMYLRMFEPQFYEKHSVLAGKTLTKEFILNIYMHLYKNSFYNKDQVEILVILHSCPEMHLKPVFENGNA